MEESQAKLFVNAPNALDGNVVTKCDTASAAFQSEEAGNVDVVADETAPCPPKEEACKRFLQTMMTMHSLRTVP